MTNVMNVLEGLYRARASISPGRFSFGDWTRCTCGHIYGAANGGLAETDEAVRYAPAEGLYSEMLAAVVEANGSALGRVMADADVSPLASAVSDATLNMAASRDLASLPFEEAKRNAAILLISTAIEKLEGEQQRAMLDVKARAEAVASEGVSGELAGLLGAGR